MLCCVYPSILYVLEDVLENLSITLLIYIMFLTPLLILLASLIHDHKINIFRALIIVGYILDITVFLIDLLYDLYANIQLYLIVIVLFAFSLNTRAWGWGFLSIKTRPGECLGESSEDTIKNYLNYFGCQFRFQYLALAIIILTFSDFYFSYLAKLWFFIFNYKKRIFLENFFMIDYPLLLTQIFGIILVVLVLCFSIIYVLVGHKDEYILMSVSGIMFLPLVILLTTGFILFIFIGDVSSGLYMGYVFMLIFSLLVIYSGEAIGFLRLSRYSKLFLSAALLPVYYLVVFVYLFVGIPIIFIFGAVIIDLLSKIFIIIAVIATKNINAEK